MPLLLIQGDLEGSTSPAGTTPDHHGDPSPLPRQPSRWRLASDNRRTPPTGTLPALRGPTGAATPTPADPGSTGPPPPAPSAAADDVAAQRVVAAATTTTPPPTTTTTTTVPVVSPVHYGQVTYYDHPAGTCASPWLPFGTVVEVTNPANGYSVSCVVNDREADTDRSIDLATSTFADIAPLSQGVIDAQLRW